MAGTYKLDKTDYLILQALQQDSNKTIRELAQIVNLSTTPVFERVRRLEKEKVIEKYVALINMDKVNCGMMAFCNVKLRSVNEKTASEFAAEIDKLGCVSECYSVSGEYDFLLKVYVSDMKQYQDFVLNGLGKIESVLHVNSSFVLNTTKFEIGCKF